MGAGRLISEFMWGIADKKELVLEKGLFASIKGHLGYPKGPVGMSNLFWLEVVFLTFLIQIKKKFFFFKNHFLRKLPIPGRFISLK